MRDPATKHKTFLPEYSEPEIELLAEMKWDVSEKLDGTNIRVEWDGQIVRFGGRTEAAQLPAKLVEHLQDRFPAAKLAAYPPCTLFGEGIGAGIQAVGGLYSLTQRFVLFDAFFRSVSNPERGYWLQPDNLADLAHTLEIPHVPFLDTMTIAEASRMVAAGFASRLGDCPAEGLVLRAPLGMLNRHGQRIITKLKTADYRQGK